MNYMNYETKHELYELWTMKLNMNYKQCCDKPKCRQVKKVWKLQWAKRNINVSLVLRSNSYAEEDITNYYWRRINNYCNTWSCSRTITKYVRGGDMRKDKGMLKGERRINRHSLIKSRVVRNCELRVELWRAVSWVKKELPSCYQSLIISFELWIIHLVA